MSKWISVDDALPDNDVPVLVYLGATDVDYEIDYMDNNSDDGSDYWANTEGYTTHWMPLPEPPK